MQPTSERPVSIHNDHGHIHSHIIFNNVNMQTDRTFETEENQGKKPDRA
ncbi:relaxase/mobilization nuclease domain-containing protein [Porcipelethomonas ammoniilytica]|nr:relaxase/mobilization nuclease domain-containing protein [Porcipelethomonas ammoniilytica]MCU6720407.1 relaxase/mobilization nuclease domain-containing protein [Porcipelethomonas ammoniilytica]